MTNVTYVTNATNVTNATRTAPRPPSPPGVRETARIVSSLVRARILLRGARLGPRVRCFGALYVTGRTGIVIEQRAVFLRGPIPTSLSCAAGAELSIGARTVTSHAVEIVARQSVQIGSDCLIASFVHIRDFDGRHTGPVVIGDGVWLAHGAVIEPGTFLGDGSVVATNAVVSGIVPARSLVAGNPARHVPLQEDDEASPRAPANARALDGADGEPDGVRAAEVRAAIIDWLDDTRLFGDAAARITSDSMALREAGLLDSLGTVELVSMLEVRFGVALASKHAAKPGTQSLQGFVELVMSAGAIPA